MIKIQYNNTWNDVEDVEIIDNFKLFIKSSDTEVVHEKYTFVKDGYYKTFIVQDNIYSPITDWDDVKVFLCDISNPQWVHARNYQTWAFYDFLYNDKPESKYASKNSNILDHVEIPIENIDPNIIFKMSYNSNGSVSYEKNDYHKTKVRISNNPHERSYYQGFHYRMTCDIPMVVI
jgi:hypothetical protein